MTYLQKGHIMSDQNDQPQGITEDQYRVQHLTQRIGEIVGDYEAKLATGSIQLQMAMQNQRLLEMQVAELQAQVNELSEQVWDNAEGEATQENGEDPSNDE